MNLLFTSVGRRGYLVEYFKQTGLVDKIIGTSNTKWTSGFSVCDVNILVPNIANEEAYINSLLQICKTYKVGSILSFYDFDIQIISKYLDKFLAIGTRPLIVRNEISSLCFDKFLTQDFLMSHSILYPKTYISLDKALNELEKGELSLPVYVKPRHGFASKNIFKAKRIEEVSLFFNLYDDMIIQEFLPGEEYSFDLLNDLDGKNIKVVCKQKVMMRAGETDQAISVKDPTLLSFGKKLAHAVGHIGPMDVDFFIKDGKPYILELNPRFGGGYPISHMAGAAFPKLIMKMLLNMKIEDSELDYKEGVIMMKNYSFINSFSDNIISMRDE